MEELKKLAYSPFKPDIWGMILYIHAESSKWFVYNPRIVGEKILGAHDNWSGCLFNYV